MKGNIVWFTKKQLITLDELECDIVKKKIEKVQNRRYITSGTVLRLTSFFHAPNGDSDIRLVNELTA